MLNELQEIRIKNSILKILIDEKWLKKADKNTILFIFSIIIIGNYKVVYTIFYFFFLNFVIINCQTHS